MTTPRKLAPWLLFLFVLGLATPALAEWQEKDKEQKPRREVRAIDRLFLSFGEEATLVDRQWWEGQIEFLDGNGFDATILRGVAAFQPWSQVEFGGRVGFGDSSTSGMLPEGNGATDLDLWAKYHFGRRGKNEYAAGGTLTIPAGDDAIGLGMDAFSFGAFGSMRHHGRRYTFHGSLGLRSNGDGMAFGFPLDGETSISGAAGVIIPANDRVSFVAEARWENGRFDGVDDDGRVLGGINLAAGKRGVFRAAVALGLSDGAADAQLIAGYASTF